MAAVPRSTIRAHYVIEEAIEHVYDVTILDKTILTTVTKYPEAVTEWIKVVDEDDDNNTFRIIGLEAMFHITELEGKRMATLQLCDGKRCLIFQMLNCVDCPPTLEKFLTDEKYGFAGIDISSKLRMLRKHFSLTRENSTRSMDLVDIAMKAYNDPELLYVEQSELVSITLGVMVWKPVVDHTQWGCSGRLSDAHVQFACIEAFLNLQMGRWLDLSSK